MDFIVLPQRSNYINVIKQLNPPAHRKLGKLTNGVYKINECRKLSSSPKVDWVQAMIFKIVLFIWLIILTKTNEVINPCGNL